MRNGTWPKIKLTIEKAASDQVSPEKPQLASKFNLTTINLNNAHEYISPASISTSNSSRNSHKSGTSVMPAGEPFRISKIPKHPAWKPELQSPRTPKPALGTVASRLPLPAAETEARTEEFNIIGEAQREILAIDEVGNEFLEQPTKENTAEAEAVKAATEMEEAAKVNAMREVIANEISAKEEAKKVRLKHTKDKAKTEAPKAILERQKAITEKAKKKCAEAEARATTAASKTGKPVRTAADKQKGTRVRAEKAKIEANEKNDKDRLANERAAKKKLEYESLVKASQSARENTEKEKVSHAREQVKKEHFKKGSKEQDPVIKPCRKTRQASSRDIEEKPAKQKATRSERLGKHSTAGTEPSATKGKEKAGIKTQPKDQPAGPPARSDSFVYCLPWRCCGCKNRTENNHDCRFCVHTRCELCQVKNLGIWMKIKTVGWGYAGWR